MATVPFAVFRGGQVVLSVETDARGRTLNWICENSSPTPVTVLLVIRSTRMREGTLPPGVTSGNIPGNLRWDINDEASPVEVAVAMEV